MARLRPISAVVGVLLCLATVVALPASAQTTETYKGDAAGQALDFNLLGVRATVGSSSAGVTSTPSALGNGVGLSLLAAQTTSTSGPLSTGSADPEEACGAALPQALTDLGITLSLACGDSSAKVEGGNPTGTGKGTVGTLGLNLTGNAVLSLVTAQLGTLLDTVCGAAGQTVPTVIGLVPIQVLPGGTTCTDIKNSVLALLAGAGNPLNLTVGDSNSKVETTADRVVSRATAGAASLSLLNIPAVPSLVASGVQKCSGPMVKVDVGTSGATATYNRTAAQLSSSFDPPLLANIRLCLFFLPEQVIPVPGPGQSITLAPTDVTIKAGSGETFTGSAGARSRAVEITGLGGQVFLALSRSEAIVDGARTTVAAGAGDRPGVLPRTGSSPWPWIPVVGAGLVGMAVLVRRILVKTR